MVAFTIYLQGRANIMAAGSEVTCETRREVILGISLGYLRDNAEVLFGPEQLIEIVMGDYLWRNIFFKVY